MTSISDAFETPRRRPSPGPSAQAVPAQPKPQASEPVKVPAVARRFKVRLPAVPAMNVVKPALSAARSDLANAWVWRGSPPTLADLWANRVPDREAVPGQNRALWTAWIVFNHLALIWTALLAVPLWVLQHPARTLLAAAVVAPIVLIWTL